MKEFCHYRESDPAFDSRDDAFNYEVWRETGDESHLPRHGDAAPVTFVCRPLTRKERDKCLSAFERHGAASGSGWGIAMSLVRIEGWNGKELAGGETFKPERTLDEGFAVANDGALDAVEGFFGRAELNSLWLTIQERSWPSPRV